MKRIGLIVGLLAVALAAVGAQSAAAAVPNMTGFSPASGPSAWSVTLTGTGFTGATSVTFTPTDPGFLPEAATFTVQNDTTIVATVPFLATKPLAATLTVETPNGLATSVSDFTVDGQVGLSEQRGASGEPIKLTGSGFTGATEVVFGTWPKPAQADEPFAMAHPVKAHFRVLGDTQIAATVPDLRAGRHYWVVVVSPAGKSVSKYPSPVRVVRPSLLTDAFGNTFAIRPATLVPSGDGSFLIGKLYSTHRGRAIHWQFWRSSRAYGVGTVWIDDGIPDEARGSFYAYAGSVSASRVRGGRFTRMAVRWRQNGRTHRETLKLEDNSSGWFWL
jgi:hypothetical protein